MKVLVCGGRDFSDQGLMFQSLDRMHAKSPITMIIAGGALGADSMADDWANARGVHCAVVKALWAESGRSAGPKRNRAMLTLGPEWVVAFPGGRGTADMVRAAKAADVKVWEVQR